MALLLYPVPVTIAAFIVWSHGHSTSFISPFPVILAAIQLPLLGGLKAWLNPSPQRRRQLLAIKVAIIVQSTFATLHFCVVP